MKKVLITLGIIFFLADIAFLVLFLHKAKYTKPYNGGNERYEQSEFEAAEEKYSIALSNNPDKDKDCDVRVNYALAIVKQVDPKKVDESNYKETIERLEAAKKILLDNGCAHDEDENGHDKDAQTLKDEIDDLIEQLKQQNETSEGQSESESESEGGGETESETETGDGEGTETETETMDIIESQLQSIQGAGGGERQSESMEWQELYSYEYYTGKAW